jgi:hypothetical protein
MATGPMASFKITRSIWSGPSDGVTPVVRNCLTDPTGRSGARPREQPAGHEAGGEHEDVEPRTAP